MELNKIYNENCLDTMARMEDNFVDLTVTSPPYDDLRTYNGYSFDFESIAKELFRITKEGGVVVWVVGDATKNGSESLTSFRQALYFKEIGFNVHDTMIYRKTNPNPVMGKRYKQCFEYMFIFSKGKPKVFNPIQVHCENTKGFVKCFVGEKDGIKQYVNKKRNEYKNIDNIFEYKTVRNKETKKHSAVFPEQLANDHIITWSNENDIVYDCFGGSGTTPKMAKANNRNWIVSEISSEYCEIIKERLNTLL
ncbi:site-specific DNA-methyltransferase [uncultured Lutibacter sp.]|uniref:DNA-methyltransferase n=1 Tax=uncultured Lutibacter sp. TaxID=437739 RepID=UPI002629BEEB|nr:site-specific DNA-methyltransferase [uncultured Lutibacter sp.]